MERITRQAFILEARKQVGNQLYDCQRYYIKRKLNENELQQVLMESKKRCYMNKRLRVVNNVVVRSRDIKFNESFLELKAGDTYWKDESNMIYVIHTFEGKDFDDDWKEITTYTYICLCYQKVV